MVEINILPCRTKTKQKQPPKTTTTTKTTATIQLGKKGLKHGLNATIEVLLQS